MATVVQRPPQPPPERPVSERRVQAVRARAHFEHVGEEIPPPRWIESLLLFLVAAGAYFWIGYHTIVEDGVVVFDALDRLTRAYMAWHNDPPKLAAIGFVFPPLTTVFFLPFTLVKPLATSLVALPLVSALFGGWMIVAMNRLLRPLLDAGRQRWLLLALFGLNPLLLFYAGNGMSEVVYLALLTFSLYCFMSWFRHQPAALSRRRRPGLLGARAAALLLRVWALVIAVMMGLGLGRRGAQNDEVEGTVITFLAPLVYALGVWILFNWLIVGDPLRWLSSSGAFAVNAPQADAAGDVGLLDVLERSGQLTLGVFALGIVVVPALLLMAIGRRDEMSLWLAVLAVTGLVVIGANAMIEQDFNALAMRNALPVLIVCVAGAAWLYRSLPGLRVIIWLAALVGFLLTAYGSWHAMQRYPFQGQEQAFVRAIKTGDAQAASNSIGGFRVGTSPSSGWRLHQRERRRALDDPRRQRPDLRRDHAQRASRGVLRSCRQG